MCVSESVSGLITHMVDILAIMNPSVAILSAVGS